MLPCLVMPLSPLVSSTLITPPPCTHIHIHVPALQDVATLHEIVGTRIDHISAHMLHRCDEYANDRGEIQIGTVQVRRGMRYAHVPG